MQDFAYRALASDGSYREGQLQAGSPAEARRQLRAGNLQPLVVTPLEASVAGAKKKRVDLDRMPLSRGKADRIALAFLDKVQQLVESGLPLGDAVKSLNRRLTEPVLAAIADALWKDLSEGASLAAAMHKHRKIFDPSVVSMIEAGESTGNLPPVLASVIELLETRIQLRKEILAGLSYPAFILGVVFCVLLFVLFYLMPRVQDMLDSMGGNLSWAAVLVIWLANTSLVAGPVLIVGGLIVTIILYQWRKSETGKLATDRFLLRVPFLCHIIVNFETSRIANLGAIMLGSSVETTETLRLIEKTIRNEDLRLRFRTCRHLISDGASFSAAMQSQHILDDLDADVLSVSENTGSLVRGFRNIYRTRHSALEQQLKRLTVFISTGALLGVFVLIFLVVFGMVSSIMQLSSSVIAN